MSHSTTTARSIIILFVSFQTSCGNKAVSEDKSESLSYTCKNDSVAETFSIPTFRYYGAEKGDAVYFHCDLRVCLADVDNSACQCPTDAECDPKGRKRRSLADEVMKLRCTTRQQVLLFLRATRKKRKKKRVCRIRFCQLNLFSCVGIFKLQSWEDFAIYFFAGSSFRRFTFENPIIEQTCNILICISLTVFLKILSPFSSFLP